MFGSGLYLNLGASVGVIYLNLGVRLRVSVLSFIRVSVGLHLNLRIKLRA